MKKFIALACSVLLMLTVLTGCGAAQSQNTNAAEKDSTAVDETIYVTASRNSDVNIPVGITVPEVKKGESVPVVLIFHGFLGDMNQGGLFYGTTEDDGIDGIANKLSRNGIATIRIDQSGCGSSKEDLTSFTLENSISDMNDAFKYVVDKYPVNPSNVAVIGHSNGGKLAPLYASRHSEVSTMVLLNPAGDNGNTCYQTAAAAGLDWKVLDKAAAEAIKSGKTEFENVALSEFFGDTVMMSTDYVDQINNSVTGNQIKNFIDSGNSALMIYGDKDGIINPETYHWILENTNIKSDLIEGMGHELGIDVKDNATTQLVVDKTTDFILNSFK